MIFSTKTFIPDEPVAEPSTDEPFFQNVDSLPSGDYGAAFAKMFLTLIVLIVLLGLTTWLLKRLFRARLEKRFGNQMIYVLEKKMLSPKTALYFIEVEGKRMVIAESHLEIRTCLEFPTEPKTEPDTL